jgi:hypothetical protein
MRSTGRILALIAGIGFLCASALADGVPPVTLKLKEQESGRFLAHWRVPKQVPPSAIPSALLPESCRSVGERSVTERPGAWFVRQTHLCPGGLAGRSIGVEYPFLNATISTLLRVELLSGDRYAHLLAPGEQNWRVPESAADDARAWFRVARQAVLAGASHFAGNGVHIALAAVLVLLGGFAVSIRLATAFAAGQLVSVAVFSAVGFQIGAPLAEIGVAAAVVLLAREALRPPAERRQLTALACGAGLVHGLGLAHLVQPSTDYDGSRIVFYGLVVLGMDAALLLAGTAGSGLRRLLLQRESRPVFATAAVYAAGIAAVALALGFPATDATTAANDASSGFQLPDLPLPNGTAGTPASRRVASSFPDAALQSFVTVAPFEVRHEVLVRLRDTAGRIDLEPSGEVAIDVQDQVKRRIHDLVAARTEVRIDGRLLEPADLRIDFLTLEARGALPRPVPVPESVEAAWLGVTTTYVTDRTPGEVLLTWNAFGAEPTVPATVTDPESSRSVELTARRPTLTWKNELSEDPTPVVSAIAVEPPVLWTPILSLVLLGAAIVFGLAAIRGRRRDVSIALSRVGLALAFLLAPIGNVALPLPSSVGSTPDPDGAKRILSRVLPNIYRAFEFPTESAAYDRLALSVTGDTLTEVYLEHRRAVTMEERGGARARVEAVEVIEVDSVEPGSPGGFVAGTVWTVGGTVTHFGHRHFRQNRYEARVAVVPVDDHWKIRSIEILEEKRLR